MTAASTTGFRIEVFVPGRPAPQGSRRYLGRPGGKGVTVESSKAVAPWRADIREHVFAALPVDERVGGLIGPFRDATAVVVDLEFVMPRPASTPKRRTPPASKRPDIDKLARAVLDAVGSTGVWRDDSQVVELRARKRLAEPDEAAGCRIVIETEGGQSDRD